MTPLMCAAYKGKEEMCELLIAQGADVNSNYHEHQVKPTNLLKSIVVFQRFFFNLLFIHLNHINSKML